MLPDLDFEQINLPRALMLEQTLYQHLRQHSSNKNKALIALDQFISATKKTFHIRMKQQA